MIGATFFLYFILHSGASNRIFAVLNDEFFSFGIFYIASLHLDSSNTILSREFSLRISIFHIHIRIACNVSLAMTRRVGSNL